MATDQSPTYQSIGARLRMARESRGLSLVDIAGTLRIKAIFLDALESDQPEALPSPAHASGFLRSYARYLGIEIASASITPPPPVIAPSSTPAPDYIVKFLPPLLVIGGLILLYALWQWLQPAEPEPIAPPPTDIAAPKLEPLEPKIEPRAEVAPTATPTAVPAESAPVETPAAPVPAEPVKPVTKIDNAKGESLVIRAVSDSWVQITDTGGRQLYSKLMRTGESWRAPQQAGLRLSTGNAGGLVLVRNGEAGAPLGAQAQVLRNLALTEPAAVKPVSVVKPSVTEPVATPAPADDAGETPDIEE